MSSLRDILVGVPQDARFHPEGDVWTHVLLVRHALDDAIVMTRQIFPEVGSDEDRCLLRIAAWVHDLGKAAATKVVSGRYVAPGHEKSASFNEVFRRVGKPWKKLWVSTSYEDRKTLLYVVTRHMGISDQRGLDARIARNVRSREDFLRRRARLAVTFMAMDRLGCASPTRVADAQLVIEAARPGMNLV